MSKKKSKRVNIGKLKKKKDVMGLIEALEHHDPQIREEAVVALMQTGDNRAVAPLISTLKDPEEKVVRASMVALGKLGDQRAIKPMIEALRVSYSLWTTFVAGLLEIGLPTDTTIQAWYWIAKEQWDKATDLAELAVEPLVSVINWIGLDKLSKPAAQALGRIHAPSALEKLLDAMEDMNYHIRSSSATALGGIGDVRSREALIAALNDQYEEVREAVVDSLCRIGSDDTVDRLIGLLNDETKDTVLLVRVLGRIGDPKAVVPLVSLIRENDSYAEYQRRLSPTPVGGWEIYMEKGAIHREAARSLGAIGDLSAVEPLVDYFLTTYRKKNSDAALALGEIGDPRAVDPLLQALQDPACQVDRCSLWRVLGKLGDRRVEPFLIEGLKSRLDFEWAAAADALEQLGVPSDPSVRVWLYFRRERWAEIRNMGDAAIDPIIEILLSPSVYVYGTAPLAPILAELGGSQALEPLITVVRGRENWDSLKSRGYEQMVPYAQALAGIRDIRCVGRFIVALRDECHVVRAAAAIALGRIGDRRAVEPLIAALRRDETVVWHMESGGIATFSDVRERAAQALGAIGDPKAVEPMIEALKMPEPLKYDLFKEEQRSLTRFVESRLHETAAAALGAIGDPEAVEPLIEALGDTVAESRAAAADALGKIGDPRAVRPLKKALSDGEPLVRKAVQEALEKIQETS